MGDVIAVAKVHEIAFPGFFLTNLGCGFLRELYSGFLSHSSGVIFVAEDAGEVVGFIAGTFSPETFFRELRRQRGIMFLIHAIPAVLRNPMTVVSRLYGAFFYQGDKPISFKNGALLSSIGVVPKMVGKNVGRLLIENFESEVISSGVDFVYLTTDRIGNDRVNAFYQKCGYYEDASFTQYANRKMFRYVKKLNP